MTQMYRGLLSSQRGCKVSNSGAPPLRWIPTVAIYYKIEEDEQ